MRYVTRQQQESNGERCYQINVYGYRGNGAFTDYAMFV